MHAYIPAHCCMCLVLYLECNLFATVVVRKWSHTSEVLIVIIIIDRPFTLNHDSPFPSSIHKMCNGCVSHISLLSHHCYIYSNFQRCHLLQGSVLCWKSFRKIIPGQMVGLDPRAPCHGCKTALTCTAPIAQKTLQWLFFLTVGVLAVLHAIAGICATRETGSGTVVIIASARFLVSKDPIWSYLCPSNSLIM